SLLVNQRQLPKTIKDAMTLVARIGERYLWVGALCIQDDAHGKEAQTAAMGRIYGSTILTIAVTEWESANAGLRGISPRPRNKRQRVENVQDILLANKLPPAEGTIDLSL